MRTLKSYNPATGELVGEVRPTARSAIGEIVVQAKGSQAQWASLGMNGRRDILLRAVSRLGENANELAHLITREMGKPLRESLSEVNVVVENFADELSDISEALQSEHYQEGEMRSTVYHDPVGVCACITPWNYPVAIPHWLILPALTAGNAVLFKPSEKTPLSGEAYARILQDVLPPYALQVVSGPGSIGRSLVHSPVDMVAFVGSSDTGEQILRGAPKDFKRVILELGGSDPLIVLRGADVTAAAAFAVRNGFRNAGQICVSTEHVIVICDLAPQLIAGMVEGAKSLVLGNGMDAETQLGPLVDVGQRDRVMRLVRDAVSQGAKILCGGAELEGSFMQPTILVNVMPSMAIAQEEILGPVVCVHVVDSEEEAVRLANDSRYALGAVIFGQEDFAQRVARNLKAGMVGINRAVRGVRGTPWVGAGHSGYGFYGSVDGHRQFTQTRVVTTRTEADV